MISSALEFEKGISGECGGPCSSTGWRRAKL
jgi:hypothetical protein